MLITEEMAKQAIELVMPMIDKMVEKEILFRREGYIIVATIDKKRRGGYKVLVEHPIGDPEAWIYPYVQICHGKVRMSARTGMSARKVIALHPELIRPGDSKYIGSAVMGDLVVGFSSTAQGHVDEIVSYSIAYICSAMVQELLDQELQDEDRHLFFKDQV